jgi:hypothetical protein
MTKLPDFSKDVKNIGKNSSKKAFVYTVPVYEKMRKTSCGLCLTISSNFFKENML